ncbi:MAG TPA: D-alanine--D-alanine ligase family protein [Chloroflexota bacterium]|nr:D-alanine--D-alanine ligase family protein [Chloroflexota bacterium]
MTVPGRRLRIGVLFGGRSGEHEVSLHSARAVMTALDEAGHEVVPIGITPQGRWLASGDPMQALSSGRMGDERAATMLPEPGNTGLMPLDSNDDPPARAAVAELDVVFPVLHGTYGEDGTVQGLFELASVPYVGSGVLGSALGMDKVVHKTLWRGLGLPVVEFVSVSRRDAHSPSTLERIERDLGYPCFVKPANLGSSVGVSKAHDRADLELALQEAARYDSKLLVERGIDARELEVAILGNDDPRASVVGEIVPSAEFYSYRAKYLDEGSRAVIPAEIPAETSAEVQRLAIAAFKAVDAAGLARVDFFLERGSGRLLVNEINTMPGFTEISMYPKLWQASGMTFAQLVARLVELAEERFAERSRNETSYQPEG